MTDPHRDLGSDELWQRSLERSRHRRAIAPVVRRQAARRKQASLAASAAMVTTPATPLAAAVGTGSGRGTPSVEPARPALAAKADVLLVVGSTGPAVTQLQRRLQVTADGIFGPQTEAAVRAFQERNGLAVDGVVGPQTWRALFGVARSAALAGASGADGASADEAAVALRHLAPSAKGSKDDPVVAFTARVETRPQDEEPGPASEERGAGDGSAGDGGRRERTADRPPSEDDAGDPAPRHRHPTPERRTAGDVGGRGTVPVSNGDDDPGRGVIACGSSELVRPVRGPITSGFGPRWGRQHEGVDIAAPSGTPIRAAACGRVTQAGWQGGYGNIVCIRHEGGLATCYAHLSRIGAHIGEYVQAGEVIGYVGCTGSCTGPHVHFETRVYGAARNPLPYLNGSQRVSGGSSSAPRVASTRSSRSAAGSGGRTSRTASRALSTRGSTPTSGGVAAGTAPGSGTASQPAAPPATPAPTAQPAPAPAAEPAAPVSDPAPATTGQPAPAQTGQPAPAPDSQAAPAPAGQPAPAPASQPAPAAPAAPAPSGSQPAPPSASQPAPGSTGAGTAGGGEAAQGAAAQDGAGAPAGAVQPAPESALGGAGSSASPASGAAPTSAPASAPGSAGTPSGDGAAAPSAPAQPSG